MFSHRMKGGGGEKKSTAGDPQQKNKLALLCGAVLKIAQGSTTDGAEAERSRAQERQHSAVQLQASSSHPLWKERCERRGSERTGDPPGAQSTDLQNRCCYGTDPTSSFSQHTEAQLRITSQLLLILKLEVLRASLFPWLF